MSIRNYAAGDELTIGGDTWTIFPQYLKYSGFGSLANTSAYQGIAYKKIV